jgi:ribonucleoside-diphosphate reductase beta chain
MSESKKNIDICKEEPDRHSLFPIRYPDVFEYWRLWNALHWVAEEVDMTKDAIDFNNKLTKGDRFAIKNILAWFAIGDEIVLESLEESIIPLIKIKEFQYVYRGMQEIECVHSHSYSIQVQTVLSDQERDEAFDCLKNYPVIKEMKEWVDKNIPNNTLENKLLVQIAVEGVFFCDKFAIINTFKQRNLLNGICTYNDFISRDEDSHVKFNSFLITGGYVNRPDEKTAHTIFKQAVSLSHKFIDVSILADDPPLGLSIQSLKNYICYNCDIRLEQLGYKPLFNIASNPLKDVLEHHAMNKTSKVDFFVRGGSQYRNPTGGALVYKINESPIELR